MGDPDTPNSPSAPALSADAGGAPAPDDVAQLLPADLPGDTIVGDVLAQGEDYDVGDLHAALISLSTDTFAYLDVALDHLTASADLFDVPGIDFDDFPHGDSGA